jgi:GGDEF domain-containing protein
MTVEIEKLKQMIERLEEELYEYKHDHLTGLLMRRDFDKKLNYMFFNSVNTFYLSIVDANGLHNINEEKGYIAGDEYIKSIVNKLKRSTDNTVYRIGGDEFAIISYDKFECLESDQYSCATVSSDGYNTIDETFNKLDKLLKAEKNKFYSNSKNERRKS